MAGCGIDIGIKSRLRALVEKPLDGPLHLRLLLSVQRTVSRMVKIDKKSTFTALPRRRGRRLASWITHLGCLIDDRTSLCQYRPGENRFFHQSVRRLLTTWQRWRNLAAQRGALAMASALLLAGLHPAYAAQVEIEPFAGTYIGDYVVEPAGSVRPGDLHLRLRVNRKGFMLDWQSLAGSEGSAKHHHNVSFVRTRRANIYIAAMRCDVFGNLRPLDPMQGGPFMWANVVEDRINLYVMVIDERGAHDLRIYRYRLEGNKMTLEFERLRDEERLRVIRGGMKKLPVGADGTEPSPGAINEEHGTLKCG